MRTLQSLEAHAAIAFHIQSLSKVRRLASWQKALVHSGLDALRDGGTLVYSTCTLAPEENELVIARALERYEEMVKLVPTLLAESVGVPALTQWKGRAITGPMGRARRILPPLEGFFIAILIKRRPRIPEEDPRARR
ncbi:MAG: hypothetical protein EXS03_06145 [Phycisphaerales bacterium]|nr:hypothetical protein [Phycisphaerales bacterium]